MKISIIQADLEWENKSANMKKLSDLIIPLYFKTDIIILPETFNSGFSMNADRLNESSDGETFRWMLDISQKGNFGVCGSYIVKVAEHYFNRWIFVSPEKESWHYDKRHLFSMGGEDRVFTPGKSRLIFNFRGFRISPYICYDLRFPVWSRNRNEYDLMINSANWPESRKSVWNTLIKARAIENQCYAAAANRVGIDGVGIKCCGDSMIVDPRGDIIASANTSDESVITAEISMTELTEFRNKFPVLDDADKFSINI